MVGAKRKNLNGLPNNLIQQYFSTMFYWKGGYMADWIWNACNEKGIWELEIDILNSNVTPRNIEIKQITTYLERLKATIEKELIGNGFEKDFIVSAKFGILISYKFKSQRLIICNAELIDNEQRIYKSKTYTEKAYEKQFVVFGETLFEKMKIWIANKIKMTAM